MCRPGARPVGRPLGLRLDFTCLRLICACMRLAFSWSTFGFHLVCDWSTLGRHVVDAWTTLGLNSVCACPPFVYTPQSTLISHTQTHVASRLSVVRGSAECCELLLCEFVSFKSSMAGDILIMLMLVVSMGDWVGDAVQASLQLARSVSLCSGHVGKLCHCYFV